jgi:transposase-like protein
MHARSNLTAEFFLRRVSERCLNKPLILVDRGPWYPYALEAQGFPYRHEAFGRRNVIEQWFSLLKARTKRFYNNYPNNSTIQSTQCWMETYTTIHNILTLS